MTRRMGGFLVERAHASRAVGVAWLALAACGERSVETRGTSDRTPWVEDSASPSASGSLPPPLPASVPLTSAAAPPLSKEQLAAALRDEATPISREVFESALLAVAHCESMTDTAFDPRCTAATELRAILSRKKAPGWRDEEVAGRYLRHPSAAVRQESASIVARRVFGPEASPGAGESAEARAFIAAVRSESEPRVLARMLRAADDGAHRSPALRELARLALDHAAGPVRQAAIDVVSRPKVLADVPASYARLVAMSKEDPEDAIRAHACKKLGETGEAAAVEHFREMLASPAVEPFVRGACFDGLVRTWVGTPQPERPSRSGYELTMKLVRVTPRGKDVVPASGLIALSYAAPVFRSEAWQIAVKDFFVADDVRSSIEDVMLDPAVDSYTREVCVSVLGHWDAHARLAELAAKLEAMPDADSKAVAKKALEASKKKD